MEGGRKRCHNIVIPAERLFEAGRRQLRTCSFAVGKSTDEHSALILHSSSSSRLCPSTAGCSPPWMSSIVVCLLLSLSRWFPPSLLCHLAIFCLVVLWTSSLSLVATRCIALSTYCPLVLLFDRPISTFVSVWILWYRWSLFFFWFPSMVSGLLALGLTFSFSLLFERFSVCHLFI